MTSIDFETRWSMAHWMRPDHVAGGALAVLVQHAQADQLDVLGDARHLRRAAADGAGDVRAVAVGVHARPAGAAGEVHEADDAAAEVGRPVDARVDHRHRDAGAVERAGGGRLVDAERPAQREGGVEGRADQVRDQAVALHRAVVRDVQDVALLRHLAQQPARQPCPTPRDRRQVGAGTTRPLLLQLAQRLGLGARLQRDDHLLVAVAAGLGLLLEVSVQLVGLAAVSGSLGREGVEPSQQQGRHHQRTQPSRGPSPHARVVLFPERFRSHHCLPSSRGAHEAPTRPGATGGPAGSRTRQVVVPTALGARVAGRR